MTRNETFFSGRRPEMVDDHLLGVQGPSGEGPAGNCISSKGAPGSRSRIGSPAGGRRTSFRQTMPPPSPPCLGVPQRDRRQLQLTPLLLPRCRTRIACLRLSGNLVYLYAGELEREPVRLPGIALRFARQSCRNYCNCNRCQAPTASEQQVAVN